MGSFGFYYNKFNKIKIINFKNKLKTNFTKYTMIDKFQLEFAFNQDIPTEDLGKGVSRKIMSYCDGLMLVRVFFEKDAIGTLHNHPHLQMSYVAEGAFEVTIGDESKKLSKGDVFFAPSMVYHGVKCIEPGELVDVFNPMREDFLK
jgi:quercetin dioxygenase-like cupin family protein